MESFSASSQESASIHGNTGGEVNSTSCNISGLSLLSLLSWTVTLVVSQGICKSSLCRSMKRFGLVLFIGDIQGDTHGDYSKFMVIGFEQRCQEVGEG